MTNLTTEEMQRIVADLTPHPLAENELRGAGVLDTMTEAKEVILAQQQEIERLRGLLVAAVCPCCDKSGAYYDNYGEIHQCQWCYEVNLKGESDE